MSTPFKSAREYADYVVSGARIMAVGIGVAFTPTWAKDENWAKFAPYDEPNPHQEGTFLWAAVEARRGNKVTCARLEALGVLPAIARDFAPWDSWTMEYIEATDWRTIK